MSEGSVTAHPRRHGHRYHRCCLLFFLPRINHLCKDKTFPNCIRDLWGSAGFKEHWFPWVQLVSQPIAVAFGLWLLLVPMPRALPVSNQPHPPLLMFLQPGVQIDAEHDTDGGMNDHCNNSAGLPYNACSVSRHWIGLSVAAYLPSPNRTLKCFPLKV